MNQPIVQSTDGVTLIAGGPVSRRDLAFAMARAPVLVAADGGADRALALGHMPVAAIGDFDSISGATRDAMGPDRLHPIDEQDSTDFDKTLRHVAAPFVLAVGVSGARIDHGLAVMNTLVRFADRVCVLVGPEDVLFHAPPRLTLHMQPGDRLSLFPLAGVTGQSSGLRWPIDGLAMHPSGQIGTSNEVSSQVVELGFSGPGMLVILPRARLDAALSALLPEGWTAPRGQRRVRGG